MTWRDILDEILPSDLAKPKNLLVIRNTLLASPDSSDTIPPNEKEISDYPGYCKISTTAGILESKIAAVYSNLILTSPHSHQSLMLEW